MRLPPWVPKCDIVAVERTRSASTSRSPHRAPQAIPDCGFAMPQSPQCTSHFDQLVRFLPRSGSQSAL
eukprot:5649808-Prymnesium_polylepis.3